MMPQDCHVDLPCFKGLWFSETVIKTQLYNSNKSTTFQFSFCKSFSSAKEGPMGHDVLNLLNLVRIKPTLLLQTRVTPMTSSYHCSAK